MMNKIVIVFEYEICEKVEDGEAEFHAWGVDYDEFDEGPGNYSTAIIVRDDGTVQNVPVEMIKFKVKQQ